MIISFVAILSNVAIMSLFLNWVGLLMLWSFIQQRYFMNHADMPYWLKWPLLYFYYKKYKMITLGFSVTNAIAYVIWAQFNYFRRTFKIKICTKKEYSSDFVWLILVLMVACLNFEMISHIIFVALASSLIIHNG